MVVFADQGAALRNDLALATPLRTSACSGLAGERASLLGCVCAPLKRNVGLLRYDRVDKLNAG